MNGSWFNLPLFLVFVLPIVVVIVRSFVRNYKRNPFYPPQIEIEFDISYRKNVEYCDYIENWIIDHKSDDYRCQFLEELDSWYSDNEDDIRHRAFLKKHRKSQLQMTRDVALSNDYASYLFLFVRKQNRYRRIDYQRISYVDESIDRSIGLSIEELELMREKLREINFLMPLSSYSQRNQRRLMTKELRQRIMLRDNYTCQKCGKYMPDTVGLHIDHIVPISKGGRSVESNLQVLCDKCNYRKGTR